MITPNKRVNELAEMISEKYYELSSISIGGENTIIEPNFYRDQDMDFRQSAIRTKIPEWVFEESADNSVIAYDFANAIANGEKNILHRALSSCTIEETISRPDVSEFQSRIESRFEEVQFILIPLDFWSEMRKAGIDRSDVDYKGQSKGGTTRLRIGDRMVPIIHSHKNFEFDDIFVVGSEALDIVQKLNFQMDSIEDQPNYLDNLTENNSPLQIMAGVDPEERDKVDFIIRSVLGVNVDENEILRAEVS